MLTLMRALAEMARASLPPRCRHRGERDYWRQADGTEIERCTGCSVRWVNWPGGRRVRALWAR